MASAAEALQAELTQLLADFKEKLAAAASEPEIRNVYARYGGSAGEIRFKQKDAIKKAPNAEKKAIGQLTNVIVAELDAELERRLAALAAEARRCDLERRIDVTLPGRTRRLGRLHPITLARREIEAIFVELGYWVAHGPEIETDFHNFEALGMSKDHPARDMQDTFYIDELADVVLRTHTSPVQIRTMLAHRPPIRIIAPGPVYRKDDDPTHSPMFNQVEGLVVDEGVTFGDLKGTLLHFARRFFGEQMGVRLRPSFFPFTEPSAEIDFSCVFCGGVGEVSVASRDASEPALPARMPAVVPCRVCKGSGWIEIGGAGMVDPEVLRHVNIDSERYTGFAFGWGIDRMAMLKYRIDNIGRFFDGDVRFTRQFP